MSFDVHHNGKAGKPAKQSLRVVHDFPAEVPVTAAVLDAVEAFLGAQLLAILADTPDGAPKPATKHGTEQEIASLIRKGELNPA